MATVEGKWRTTTEYKIYIKPKSWKTFCKEFIVYSYQKSIFTPEDIATCIEWLRAMEGVDEITICTQRMEREDTNGRG